MYRYRVGWVVRRKPHEDSCAGPRRCQDRLMTQQQPDLSPDDWRRIGDALRYLGRDLHHRSFSVTAERRELLWDEMDRCLALADRLSDAIGNQSPAETSNN